MDQQWPQTADFVMFYFFVMSCNWWLSHYPTLFIKSKQLLQMMLLKQWQLHCYWLIQETNFYPWIDVHQLMYLLHCFYLLHIQNAQLLCPRSCRIHYYPCFVWNRTRNVFLSDYIQHTSSSHNEVPYNSSLPLSCQKAPVHLSHIHPKSRLWKWTVISMSDASYVYATNSQHCTVSHRSSITLSSSYTHKCTTCHILIKTE